jgi:arylsulfatase A-like enzyme
MSSWAFVRFFAPLGCALALLGPVGCRDRSSTEGASAPLGVATAAGSTSLPPGTPAVAPPPPVQTGEGRLSARSRLRSVRPLIAEARRAELDLGGLVLDFGTADQLKYTAGGWGNSWGERRADADGTTYAETKGPYLPVTVFQYREAGPARQIALRLRSRGGPRSVSVTIDQQTVGRARFGTSWTTMSFPMPPNRVALGPLQIDLYLDGGGDQGGADVDWIWLGKSRDGALPQVGPRVAPMTFGEGTRRALLAPTPRSYVFYLEVPRAASLVFDYAGDIGTRFLVRARSDRGAGPRLLFDGKVDPGRWKEGVVDLSALAGRAIKLELITTESISAGWGDPEIMVPRDETPAPPLTHKPARNVILLVMDTARADMFRPFNARSVVRTPSYDKLATQSTVFPSAYANENWTKPSVATILSGLYPSTHGTKTDSDVLSSDVRLISEHLKKRSFTTAAFVANGFCSEKFGFKRGWDTYTNYIRENKPSEAEHVFGDAIGWLQRHKDERFFLYLQTIDPHVPYAPPPEYTRIYHPEEYRGKVGPTLDGIEQLAIASGKKPVGPEDWAWIKALYEAEITYHDTHLGKFFEAVADLGILDDTLVVVTNDHGEEIRDHGKAGHGHSLYDELVRAPLLMRYPALFRPGQRVREPVENVDIYPTILEALGLEPVSDVDGVSVLPMLEGKPPSVPSYAISEFRTGFRAVRVGRWKMIAGQSGERHLYDLEVDPAEQVDQARRAPIARRMCEQHLAEFLANPAKTARFREGNVPQRRFRPGFVKQDPELRRQLEALGYFGGIK